MICYEILFIDLRFNHNNRNKKNDKSSFCDVLKSKNKNKGKNKLKRIIHYI